MKLDTLFKELKKELSQVYGEDFRGLYLYGSYARGEDDPESDLDLVLVLTDFNDYWEEIQRTSELVSEFSLKYDVSICPVIVRESDWLHGDSPFLNNVRKEIVSV